MKLAESLYKIRTDNFYKNLPFEQYFYRFRDIKCINCGHVFNNTIRLQDNHGDLTGICLKNTENISDYYKPFCYKPEIIPDIIIEKERE